LAAGRECNGVRFAPGGRHVASASSAGTAIYSLPAGRDVLRLASGPTADHVIAFSPDGRRMAAAGNQESTAIIWDVADITSAAVPANAKPNVIEMESWLMDLASSDPTIGYAAVWKLAACGDEAVDFLKRALRRRAADAKEIQRLIAELDDAKYLVREQATRKLLALDEEAVGPLRQARKGKPSAEQVKRIDDLLAKLEGPVPSSERLRLSRGIAVLEQIGGERARMALESLSSPANIAVLVEEAEAALRRQ
jgi:hypothetical protein